LNSAIGQKDTPSSAMNAGSIAPPVTVVLFIGPEGGFMAEEVRLAQRYGVQVVTLGSRTLRAETAALASIANVMYELE
jgi:16S rRNA (uracil1498-N3)-methyltransferase